MTVNEPRSSTGDNDPDSANGSNQTPEADRDRGGSENDTVRRINLLLWWVFSQDK